MAGKSVSELVVGYSALTATVGLGVYTVGRAALQLYRTWHRRALAKRAHEEALRYREQPRTFTADECARQRRRTRAMGGRGARRRSRLSGRVALTRPASTRALPLARGRRLAVHDGRHPAHALFLAVKGRVLDVHETGSDFYGPEGPYKHLAGRDGSRALALMSLKAEDALADLTGLEPEQLSTLDDWAEKLYAKYPKVGVLKGSE